MRILLYGLNYAPELTGIGKYSGEMAQWLVQRGHQVRVVTAPPYYPQWRVAAGFSAWRYSHEHRTGAAEVWRAPLWVPANPSGARRLLHLASFALTSLPLILRQAVWRPQVVVVVVPTLFTAPAGWLVARLAGGKACLHIQDFEVDAAFDLGLLRHGGRRRVANGLERLLLRRFDQVSTISDNMLARLLDKGVEADRCFLFPNWVDTAAIHPLPTPNPFRQELRLGPEQVVALYSGNMGRKQGLEVLADAARRLADHPAITFVFAGAGESRPQIEAATAGLPNVRWLPLQPAERLNELLNLADIHLLPQRADAADLVMPSKLTGMLASGRPVIATAAPGTQVGDVVAQCGLVVPPADPAALAQAIRLLAGDPPMRARLGGQARDYAVNHLGREALLSSFESQLERIHRPDGVAGDRRPV